MCKELLLLIITKGSSRFPDNLQRVVLSLMARPFSEKPSGYAFEQIPPLLHPHSLEKTPAFELDLVDRYA